MSALSLYLTFDKKFKRKVWKTYVFMLLVCIFLTSFAAKSFSTNLSGEYAPIQKLIYWGLFVESVLVMLLVFVMNRNIRGKLTVLGFVKVLLSIFIFVIIIGLYFQQNLAGGQVLIVLILGHSLGGLESITDHVEVAGSIAMDLGEITTNNTLPVLSSELIVSQKYVPLQDIETGDKVRTIAGVKYFNKDTQQLYKDEKEAKNASEELSLLV